MFISSQFKCEFRVNQFRNAQRVEADSVTIYILMSPAMIVKMLQSIHQVSHDIAANNRMNVFEVL